MYVCMCMYVYVWPHVLLCYVLQLEKLQEFDTKWSEENRYTLSGYLIVVVP